MTVHRHVLTFGPFIVEYDHGSTIADVTYKRKKEYKFKTDVNLIPRLRKIQYMYIKEDRKIPSVKSYNWRIGRVSLATFLHCKCEIYQGSGVKFRATLHGADNDFTAKNCTLHRM